MTKRGMVEIFEDKAALSEAAAQLFVTKARAAVAQNGRFLVALSGGSTPAMLFELLRERPYANQMPWSKTVVFWGDERIVPPTDDGSNYKQANDLLLSHVPIPPDNVFRAKGELSPEEAAADYALQVATLDAGETAVPAFDLILLGMGTDGHTASLFPGAVSAAEQTEPVIAVTADYDGRPANRVSFTPLLINQADTVVVLVAGANKAETLHNVLHGAADPETYPIQRIQPANGQLLWFVEKTAASHLHTS